MTVSTNAGYRLRNGFIAALALGLAVVLLVASPSDAVPHKAKRADHPAEVNWGATLNKGFLNGVYGECRRYWLWQAQLRQFAVQNTPCPFGPFAANIVNHRILDPSNIHIDGHDCGKFIEGNTGERGANKNPALHAELEAHFRLMDCTLHPENCVLDNDGNWSQTQAQNKTYFNQLSMYSTGESCSLDANLEALAGYGEVIFGLPQGDQINAGWPVSELTSSQTFHKARTPTLPDYLIGGVDIEKYRPLYVWQYDSDAECPTGCVRTPDGSRCTKATQT